MQIQYPDSKLKCLVKNYPLLCITGISIYYNRKSKIFVIPKNSLIFKQLLLNSHFFLKASHPPHFIMIKKFTVQKVDMLTGELSQNSRFPIFFLPGSDEGRKVRSHRSFDQLCRAEVRSHQSGWHWHQNVLHVSRVWGCVSSYETEEKQTHANGNTSSEVFHQLYQGLWLNCCQETGIGDLNIQILADDLQLQICLNHFWIETSKILCDNRL